MPSRADLRRVSGLDQKLGTPIWVASIVGIFALFCAHNTPAAPAAELKASRTSGPAPLAVIFDATGTTDTEDISDPFREFGYRFEFDDPDSGTWEHSGLSKNEQIGGPISAHVFDFPGTYEVGVTVRSRSGEESSRSVTITVESADAVFADSDTICISMTSDFTSCPAEADHVSDPRSWMTVKSRKRYLLHVDQDFTSLGSLSIGNVKDVQIGTFGDGLRPKLDALRIMDRNPIASNWEGKWMERVTFMNLDVSDIAHGTVSKDLLFYRLRVNPGQIQLAATFNYYLRRTRSLSKWTNGENIFFVENLIDSEGASDDGKNITAGGIGFVAMGNTLLRPYSHNFRIWQTARAFIAHNFFDGKGLEYTHALKIHGTGLDPVLYEGTFADAQGIYQRTSNVVVANNAFGEGNNNWIVSIRPQNAESSEGVENVIVEDNRFEAGANHSKDITFTGRNMTSRGNWNSTFEDTADTGIPENSALPRDWIGPYFESEPSIRELFHR